MFRKTFDFFQTALQKNCAKCLPTINYEKRLFAATAGRRSPFLRCAPLLCKCKHGMKRHGRPPDESRRKVFFSMLASGGFKVRM